MVDRSKKELRAALLQARMTRTPAELESARGEVRRHVVARAAEAGWRRIAGYVPLRTEPGSVELLAALDGLGIEVLVPQTLPDRDLSWYRWPGAGPEAEAELLGIEAISEVDAVLVPALAVTRSGIRLGRGGGSYDRALLRVPATVTVAALIFDDELVLELPAASWDVPVRSVVRPSGWSEL
ncbi:5-formyltetrahydrofolate cyclo-ligase [Jatrophihabitans sp. GAS493]|uniref:5-formyltetrahydrofolate cyclo-ligase n=1 Tax=Jatrophihabitans sp. GAS493 TaxID=1907575 RepID=UPI000BBFF690|nr:5-formyltetrahydrofolate cyclo-ligase [Jatrophihabitans sp. GAS493]SOD72507.1 5-formyltetrahydrofolate cyclo-ligase [Jatrophihabitans sp. GAS493]